MQKQTMDKKGQMGGGLWGLAIGGVLLLIVGGAILVFGTSLTSSLGSGFTANSTEANVSTDVLKGFTKVSGQWGNVGLAIAFGLVIAIILGVVAYKRG